MYYLYYCFIEEARLVLANQAMRRNKLAVILYLRSKLEIRLVRFLIYLSCTSILNKNYAISNDYKSTKIIIKQHVL